MLSALDAHRRHAPACRSRSCSVARSAATARWAKLERVSRSAHSSPHHLRSSGVAKHHELDDVVMSENPALSGPRRQESTAVGLAADLPGDPFVEGAPLVQFGVVGKPEHGAVVPVASGDDAVGATDPAHLGQRRHRVGQVLEHLVGVHHVERSVGESEVADVADLELDVVAARRAAPGPGRRRAPPRRRRSRARAPCPRSGRAPR